MVNRKKDCPSNKNLNFCLTKNKYDSKKGIKKAIKEHIISLEPI